MSLVATAALAIWPAVAYAARATPRQEVIDGHCLLVDAHGVPLTDSRTGSELATTPAETCSRSS